MRLASIGLLLLTLLFMGMLLLSAQTDSAGSVNGERITSLSRRVDSLEDIKAGDRLARMEALQQAMKEGLDSIQRIMIAMVLGIMSLVGELMVRVIRKDVTK